ncbi:kinase-like domain-containing protein [Mycena leptocephala]|nr:kinase-like domain-containing protein [Mycena leptocephala]
MADLAETISRTISPDGSDVTVVDMSQTESVFWPLVRGLMMASPEYRRELARNTPKPLSSPDCALFTPAFPRNPVRPASYYDPATFIDTLICEPLKHRHHASAFGLPRTTIIVHGLRSLQQAEEMYKTIDMMHDMLEEVEPVPEDEDIICRSGPIRDWYEPIVIVVISNPGLFGRVKDVSLRSICTLYASRSGWMYSENRLTPPPFYKNLFVLLEDRIHLTGGHEGEQLYTTLTEMSILAETDPLTAADDATHSTLSLFSALNHALETRKRILECLTKAKNVTQSDINVALIHDGIKISQVLQMLFEIKSYEKDFPLLPRDHALAVLNLTNHILDTGAAVNREIIPNYNIFAGRAHSLLNHLAQYLELLPDDLAIRGVVLINPRPVKQGGFSDIYHGRYIKAADKEVEVAIKVLTSFVDQPDGRRQILHGNFSREALIWYHLKHENIVPFLGVDLTTFTSPVKGMVSQWMPLGSVLKYMGEKSPCGPYAVELLCDVIGGLKYLHSLDIVHGDLCGRNILMDNNGRAYLTDFGLAGFVESDTSIITSSRDGSKRWMAPELHRPEGTQFQRTLTSDIWAFGCVACEIWSEGEIPFSHIGQGRGFIFPFPESTDSGLQVLPYENKPHDEAQSFMPDGIWDLVQWCWNFEPSERPEVEMISEMLAEMSSHSKLAEPSPGTLNSRPVSSAPVSNTRSAQRSNKGIRGSRAAEGYSTVFFGPLDLDGDPEDIFGAILNGLMNFVRWDALAKPVLVEEHDKSHLALRFHSLVEANNFSMTWMVHRFEPYAKVSATLARRT